MKINYYNIASIPIEHADDVIKVLKTSISCELSNPPKCIHD